jgi:alcohol dehydrogenase YqhD (iron-dependent ADH family)
MGSKQDPNSVISNEETDAKIQIMTSGMAPNRVLIKAFLQKAVNAESTLT